MVSQTPTEDWQGNSRANWQISSWVHQFDCTTLILGDLVWSVVWLCISCKWMNCCFVLGVDCRPPFKVPFLFCTSGISQPSRIGQLGGEFHLKTSFLIWIWYTCDHPWFGHECTPHLIHWELASPLNGPGDLLDLCLLCSFSSKYFGSAFFVSLSVNGIIVD